MVFDYFLKNSKSQFSELKVGRCTDLDAEAGQVIKTPFKDGCLDVIGSTENSNKLIVQINQYCCRSYLPVYLARCHSE